MVQSECSRLDQLVATTMKKILVLGLDDGPNSYIGPASPVAVAVFEKKLGTFFVACPGPEMEGALFDEIFLYDFEVTLEDTVKYALNMEYLVDIHSCLQQMSELACQLKSLIMDLTLNHLHSDVTVDYLTCARVLHNELPWVSREVIPVFYMLLFRAIKVMGSGIMYEKVDFEGIVYILRWVL